MSDFTPKSLAILGRQPALGLAELESLYGPERIQPIGGAALLDIPAGEINFKRLGGTLKVAQLLTILPSDDWKAALSYLVSSVPTHLQYAPEGKFTLGLSVYGAKLNVKKLNADLLSLKKEVRKTTGRSIRIVPNKTLQLNSAQVMHNNLTKKGAWELLLVAHNQKFYLAQTFFVQDIDDYAARDQARPKRDARVGMLPPKLAQIIVNLAAGPLDKKAGDRKEKIRILDPFCGTGVLLQEALLTGYSVQGTDVDRRMIDYTRQNLQWLFNKYPQIQGHVVLEVADATTYTWPRFSVVASEAHLGQPLGSLPPPDKLRQIIDDANQIIEKFLANLAPQLQPHQKVVLAVPAWQVSPGKFKHLPVIDHLTDIGYNYLDLKHVRREDLLYFREDQIVARQLIVLEKV